MTAAARRGALVVRGAVVAHGAGPDDAVADAMTTTSELAAGAQTTGAPRSAQDARVDADRALFARYLDRRDPVDRDVLVERFLPLARAIARRYWCGSQVRSKH